MGSREGGINIFAIMAWPAVPVLVEAYTLLPIALLSSRAAFRLTVEKEWLVFGQEVVGG